VHLLDQVLEFTGVLSNIQPQLQNTYNVCVLLVLFFNPFLFNPITTGYGRNSPVQCRRPGLAERKGECAYLQQHSRFRVRLLHLILGLTQK
jgi:hypothetical protein